MISLKKTIVSGILSSIVLGSCSEQTSISFACDKDKKENYVIKWEIYPAKDQANAEIFSSNNDSIFSRTPIHSCSASNCISILPKEDNSFRKFFRIKVDNSYSGIISNRHFQMDSVQNLRDIGGYYTRSQEQVRWAKLYRSGQLSSLTKNDIAKIDSLHIKTVIDFRSSSQLMDQNDMYPNATRIDLPIDANNFSQKIKEKILDETFYKGDALIYTQDCYRRMVQDYAYQYAKFFDILCNEDNYPILYHCGIGNDRTGLATYFLLKALDVPNNIIEEDFLLSNTYINRASIMREGKNMPEPVQEAITTLLTADISHLRYAISCMKKESGSVEEYMKKELHLTTQKKEKLKKILLYQ